MDENAIIVGRLLIAVIFIRGGLMNAWHPHPHQIAAAAGLRLPFPSLMVRLNAANMFVGGVLLGFGIAPQLGALLLIASMIPTTVSAHQFWKETEPGPLRMKLLEFLKNVAIVGGLLVVYALGPVRALYGW
jgi:putative oxidoreductase